MITPHSQFSAWPTMFLITRQQHLKPCTHNQRDLGPIMTESNFLIPHNKAIGYGPRKPNSSVHAFCLQGSFAAIAQRQALITASFSNQTTSNAFLSTVEPEKKFLKLEIEGKLRGSY